MDYNLKHKNIILLKKQTQTNSFSYDKLQILNFQFIL